MAFFHNFKHFNGLYDDFLLQRKDSVMWYYSYMFIVILYYSFITAECFLEFYLILIAN